MGAKIPNSAAPRRQRRAEEDDDGAPLLATSDVFDTPSSFQGQMRPVSPSGKRRGAGHAGHTSARKKGAINLKTVAQACIDAGLDPAAEIARVLSTKVPVLDAKGKQVVDKQGKPVTTDLIDADTKIRTLTELLQYNQPKLKAVEMKISGSLEMTGDELDQRIAALMAKAVSK